MARSKKTTMKTSMVNLVSILDEEGLIDVVGEATASLLYNPTVAWAKFVLTDNMPNGNGMRIPGSEFENLMDSGIHMPVKMTPGRIENHDGATPLGVITHLMEEGDKIIALAALWERERPSDVDYIKSRFKAGEPVDISWEILYGDYAIAPDGTMDLIDVSLRAATIVSDPAYGGRTPVLAVAAKKWSKAFINSLPDSSFMHVSAPKGDDGEVVRLFPIKDMDGKIDKDRVRASITEMADCGLPANVTNDLRKRAKRLLEMLDSNASLQEIEDEVGISGDAEEDTIMEDNKLDELKQLQDKVAELQTALQTATDELAAKTQELESKETVVQTLETELSELRSFKSSIELEAEKLEKIEQIKTRFVEAGIEKDDEYFTQNSELLLGLSESAFDFMIQELVAFGKKPEKVGESSLHTQIPNLPVQTEQVSITSLAQALRERKTK